MKNTSPISNILRISIIQYKPAWEDKQKNLTLLERIIQPLSGQADLMVLPEMFSTGFSMKPAKLAETMNGHTMEWLAQSSVDLNAAITGSLIVREGERFYNRLIWVTPGGKVEYYDKRHLFRMGEEHLHYSAGNRRLVVAFRGWRICPLVCYDLRFPVWSRNRMDYDLLLYVANWPEPRRDVWKTLLQARAIENQCYVAGVNRIGTDGRQIQHAGDSMIIDPRGRVISQIEPYTAGVSIISLSLDELRLFREKFPVHLDADNFFIT